MSTNCERRRDLGAVQLAVTSSYSTSAVSCCAHSEQLNMSRSQPGVPVRAMSYSRIARPQLGHAGVLPTGCSDDLNKLNWGIAPLLPTNSQQRNLFRDWFCHGLREQLTRAHVRFGSLANICSAKGHVRFAPNSDRESGFPQTVMSALPPKADMCGALAHVCFGPEADIVIRSPRRRGR